MKNKRSSGRIYPIKWSPVSHDTNFVRFSFENSLQWYGFKARNRKVIQQEWLTMTPVVDQHGSLYNPVTPIVFFLN